MTHDDVIRLARQVADPDTVDPLCGGDQRDLITLNLDEMVRFAALVAAEVAKCEACGAPHALYCLTCCEESIVQTAVKEEREACALICENIEDHDETISDTYYSEHYAKAIRARGEA